MIRHGCGRGCQQSSARQLRAAQRGNDEKRTSRTSRLVQPSSIDKARLRFGCARQGVPQSTTLINFPTKCLAQNRRFRAIRGCSRAERPSSSTVVPRSHGLAECEPVGARGVGHTIARPIKLDNTSTSDRCVVSVRCLVTAGPMVVRYVLHCPARRDRGTRLSDTYPNTPCSRDSEEGMQVEDQGIPVEDKIRLIDARQSGGGYPEVPAHRGGHR